MNVLRVNGVDKEFVDGLPETLSELLGQLGVNEATVVAEVDGRVIGRAKFAETRLAAGQKIELVRFVGGG